MPSQFLSLNLDSTSCKKLLIEQQNNMFWSELDAKATSTAASSPKVKMKQNEACTYT